MRVLDRQLRKYQTRESISRFGLGAVVVGSVAIVCLSASRIQAAPLSGGQGNPPYQKLAVYQGIVTLAPNATQVLKLGNYNATYNAIEIESNSSPALRPKTGIVTIAPQNNSVEGGEIRLLPGSGSYPEWHLDAWTDTRGTGTLSDDLTYGRIFTSAEKLRLGPSGDAHILGRFCFGSSVSPADCLGNWVTFAGTGNQDLNGILSYGNRSQRSIYVGNLFSRAILESIKPFFGGYNPSWNAITAKSTAALSPGNGSAVYAENANGFAGTFIGRTAIMADSVAPSFGADTELRVAGSVPKANGAVVEAINQTPLGLSARITGSSFEITGNGAGTASATEAAAVLMLNNTSATGTTLKVRGGLGQVAINTQAGNASAGNTTYGIYAEMGTVSSGALSYAGYFRGPLFAPIINIRPYGGTEPWGIKFSGDARLKQTVELQVCNVGDETCFGRYVQTINTASRNTVAYCYDTGAAVLCDKLVYASGAAQQYELR